MYLKFWFKTLLYRYCPFRFGYLRSLDKVREPGYVYSRDKHPVRNKHHKKGGWKNQKQGNFQYRNYEGYEEYVTHQAQKFNEKLKVKGGFTNREIAAYRYRFYRRFRHLPAFLPRSGYILCAGARQGTEVEVLHDLGFKNAYGIDLNPGPDNKFVRVGDFMKLDNPDSSLDMIYCNSIDHAFNLESFFSEHARVIKPDGYVLYDVALQEEGAQEQGAFETVQWESDKALILLMLKYFKRPVKMETEANWRWILLQGKGGA